MSSCTSHNKDINANYLRFYLWYVYNEFKFILNDENENTTCAHVRLFTPKINFLELTSESRLIKAN